MINFVQQTTPNSKVQTDAQTRPKTNFKWLNYMLQVARESGHVSSYIELLSGLTKGESRIWRGIIPGDGV